MIVEVEMLNWKVFWVVRACFYKFFFGKLDMVSYIGKPIFLSNVNRIFIGKRVRIYPLARLEVMGEGKITIESNVSIGQCFHVISGIDIKIERGVTVSANVFISDLEHGYKEIGLHIMEQPLFKAKVVIGEGSFLGYGSVIRAGTRLGKQCIVGANSVVKGDFPDYCVIAGNPANIISKYNKSQMKWEKQINPEIRKKR
jgi:acetyltransferase-like isoleucine patch superfamily enzyme